MQRHDAPLERDNRFGLPGSPVEAGAVAARKNLAGGGALLAAFAHSVAGWRHLMRYERAFRLEAAVFAAAILPASLIASDMRHAAVLLGSLLLVMIVETLNTGIEAACNARSTKFDANIKVAKDCGSLAVLLALVLAMAIWSAAAYHVIVGML